MNFELKYIDSSIQKESKYIKGLLDDFGNTKHFTKDIGRVSIVCSKRKIDKSQLNVFFNSNDNGIIYLILDKRQFEILNSLFSLLMSGTIDTDELFSFILSLYKNIMNFNNELSLLFELTILKSFIVFYKNHSKDISNKKRVFDNSINILRDILIKSRNDICSYNIFNREIHKEILDKSSINYSPVFIDDWKILKEKIHSYFLPHTFFVDLVHFFNTLASLDKEVEIINYFDEKTIWSIDDITNPPYAFYLPYLRDEIKGIILKAINKKSKQTLDYLLKEEHELNSQISQIKNEIKEALKDFENNFSKEIEDSLIYPANISLVGKINSYIIDFNRKVMGNILTSNHLFERYNLLKKKIVKNEQIRNIKYDELMNIYKQNNYIENSEIFLSILSFDEYSKRLDKLFDKHHKYIVQTAKKSLNTIKSIIKKGNGNLGKEELILMENILISKGLKKDFNYELVKDNYIQIMKSIENDIVIHLLLSNIKVYNYENVKDSIKYKKERFFINNYLVPNGKIYIISNVGEPQINPKNTNLESINEAAKIIKTNYSRLVSTLVYDIRGSSFMSAKLNNAEKQKFIIKKFQNNIIPLIKNNHGIPVKETGDGGIAIFAHQTKELYRNIYKESLSSKNVHIRHSIATGSDIHLKEDNISSKRAILCANSMINKAEDFIKNNYINYRDWFMDVHEKKLTHEGIEYALLPPEFKSLFRIGVGITSGIINKNIEMTINAFGDIDLYGADINEAKFLSEQKDPQSSVIIIDHPTLFHFALSADFFINETKEDNNDLMKEILNIVNNGIINKFYSIENVKIKLYGYYLTNKIEKSKRIINENLPDSIYIDKSGNLLLNEDPIKLLYQIII